jgi:hypothetical protein
MKEKAGPSTPLKYASLRMTAHSFDQELWRRDTSFGGPDRDRTDDLFHAMLQKPNYRRHSIYEPVQSAKPARSAIFAAKMLPDGY